MEIITLILTGYLNVFTEKWQAANGPEERLPGVNLENYTPEQMFWISAAHQHCNKFTDDSLINWLKNDKTVHTAAYFRVQVCYCIFLIPVMIKISYGYDASA